MALPVLGLDRALHHLTVEPDHEHEPGQVEEQLHRLQDLEGAGGQAAVEVVHEDHDPLLARADELGQRALQGGEAGVVERLRLGRGGLVGLLLPARHDLAGVQ
jgi:hypothetical protein